MMDIKFRAWDIDKKFIYPWEKIKLNLDAYLQGQDDIVLMQYTGLKDKNGKEAYHKDRVCFLTIDAESGASDEWTGTIEWDKEDLCWYVSNDSDVWPVVKFRFIDYFEITGNDYEGK